MPNQQHMGVYPNKRIWQDWTYSITWFTKKQGFLGLTTGAVPAMKPEVTAIGNIARRPLENNLNV